MVEVFKTNVQEADESKRIIQKLLEHFPSYKINLDLEDCDRILRIESKNINLKAVAEILTISGIWYEVLHD